MIDEGSELKKIKMIFDVLLISFQSHTALFELIGEH